MKYIFRALRYFVFICLLLALILAALVLCNLVDRDISSIFRNGYDSLWHIALMFFAISFIYPRFGYTRRGALVPGEYRQIRGGVISYMELIGYRLLREDGEDLVFVKKSPLSRLLRKSDDTITMTRELPGFYVEGPVKDVMRICSGLEEKFRPGSDGE